MFIYKLDISSGLLQPAIHSKFEFNSKITNELNLKRLIRKLMGSIKKDASFLISIAASGKIGAIFILNEGFPNNTLFSKELLADALLSNSHTFIIISFFVENDMYTEDLALSDFIKIKETFNLLTLNLIDYYIVINNYVHSLVRKNESREVNLD